MQRRKDHIHFWTLSAEELVGLIVKQTLSPVAALASHDYILKIVPTVYEDLSGRQRFSYQYTVANKVLPRLPTPPLPFPRFSTRAAPSVRPAGRPPYVGLSQHMGPPGAANLPC